MAVATAPFSERDAAKRIFDASKPLKAADIDVLDALAEVAAQRKIVTEATVKGDLSTRLTKAMDEPFLRHCNPCNATHLYEQPFRLAALQAGLELEPGTSPPVLRRIPKLKAPMYRHLGAEADPRFDVVRTHLRFQGPISVRDTATYVDAPMPDVEDRWPADVVEVRVKGEGRVTGRDVRFLLADDLDALIEAALPPAAKHLAVFGPSLGLVLHLLERDTPDRPRTPEDEHLTDEQRLVLAVERLLLVATKAQTATGQERDEARRKVAGWLTRAESELVRASAAYQAAKRRR